MNNNNTKLESVTEQIGEDPTGKLLEGIMALLAEFDNDIRKIRCSGGMLGRIKKGIFPWHPPIGYLSEHNKKQDKKKENPDPIDPIKFPILKRALKEFAKGQYTLSEFADALRRYGLKTSHGGKLDLKFVNRLLNKHLSFYAGLIANPFYPKNGEQWYDGKHEPMITKDELFSIIQIRDGKNKKVVKFSNHNHTFPLKNILHCMGCGKKLTGSLTKGKCGHYPYYHCYNTECKFKERWFLKKKIEGHFVEYLKKISPKPQTLELFRKMVIEHWVKKGRVFELQKKEYEKEITELNAKKKRVYEMREDGEYTKVQATDRIAEIDSQILALNISVNETKIEQFDVEATVTYATKFISNVSCIWNDLPPELKPRFQKLIFPEGISYSFATNFRTPKICYIYTLNKKIASKKRQIVHDVDYNNININRMVQELSYLVEVLRH
jgi:site-specific DNA recombinase